MMDIKTHLSAHRQVYQRYGHTFKTEGVTFVAGISLAFEMIKPLTSTCIYVAW